MTDQTDSRETQAGEAMPALKPRNSTIGRKSSVIPQRASERLANSIWEYCREVAFHNPMSSGRHCKHIAELADAFYVSLELQNAELRLQIEAIQGSDSE